MAHLILISTLCAGLFATEGKGYRTAIPVDGEAFPARLVTMDDDGNIQFEAADGNRRYAPRDLVSWGGRRELEKGPVVLLFDASVLNVFPEVSLIGDTLKVQSDVFRSAEIPRNAARGILFRVPASRPHCDAMLDQIATSRADEDQVILESGDILEGTISTITDLKIRVMADTDSVEIDRQLAKAVIFNIARGQSLDQQGNRLLVGFRDGSLVTARQLRFDRAGGVLDLVSGAVLIPEEGVNLCDEICLLRPFADRVQYLSDMDPLGYKHIPMLQLEWPYHDDRNVLGQHLRCGSRLFTKGLGMHSTSRLAYRLEQQSQRFEAEIGIDDCTKGRGSVICRVYTDEGSGDWKRVYETPILRGDDNIVRMSVDVLGAKRLSLIVDRADQGEEWDHVNWLNARLVKK